MNCGLFCILPFPGKVEEKMMHKTLCVVSPSPPPVPPPKHPVTEIGGNFVVLNGSWASAKPKLKQFF